MSRSSRKDEILQAALACVTEHGVDGTTIEMIRDRSGASIGSLYHHFGNKERILGALYLAGVSEYADLLEAGFKTADSAEACVKLLVTSYVDWVAANPDWARFILHSRGRVEAGELGDQLREANRLHFARVLQALASYREQGLFKELPVDCFAPIVIGPVQDFTRNWLAGRTQSQLLERRELFAQMAWESVRARQEA
ncbi:HTH-type transcriptional repressor Bm3R1 [compost metagenome]